jgi:hypothetical protein
VATKCTQARETLQNAYLGNAKVKLVKLQLLRKDIEIFQIKESDFMNDLFTQTMILVTQIKTNGNNIYDQLTKEKVLRILPFIFDPIIEEIEE